MSIFAIPWVKSLLFILGGILGGIILGWVVGKIIALVRYPDPNKTRLYSGRQLLIVMGVVSVSVILILFAVLYKPKAKDPDITDPEDPFASGDMLPEGGETLPVGGTPDGGEEPLDDAPAEGDEPADDADTSEDEGESSDGAEPGAVDNVGIPAGEAVAVPALF